MKKEAKNDKIPYSEGHEAYYMGHKLSHNPYKKNSSDWEEWRMGWEDEKNDDPYWHKSHKQNK